MGEFKFQIPENWEIQPRHARTIHVIGLDGIPRPCSVNLLGNLLTITRNQNESGKTYVSYPFSDFGELTICTGTLLESEKPYDLVTELARGTINRLRNQISIWQEGGLDIPSNVDELTRQSIDKLGRAIVGGNDNGSTPGQDALEIAMDAIFALCDKFGEEISEYRVSQTEIPSFWQAIAIPTESESTERLDVFDLIQDSADCNGNQVSHENHQKLIVGPILDASPMSAFSTDISDFQQGRRELLEAVDEKLHCLPKNTALIHAVCNLNGIGHRKLSYRQQIQLTNDILNRIENSQINVPTMLSFDYPWAERLAWSVGGTHPLQIAEDLMRSGAQIAFIGLDINLDYWPGGSVARDPLQWIDLIDSWCQLGLPLVLCLRVPHSVSIDEDELLVPSAEPIELAIRNQDHSTVTTDKEVDTHKTAELPTTKPMINSVRDNLTDSQRSRLLKTILKIAVARPGVHGIIWRQWSDSDDSRYPAAGLVSPGGSAKPTLSLIESLKTETLKR